MKDKLKEVIKGREKAIGIGIVAAAVLTVIVIAAVLKPGRNTAVSEGPAEAESTMSEEEKRLSDFVTYGMQKDAVPGIIELVKSYQDAKLGGDAALMYRVFGRTDTEGQEEMQTRLIEEAKVYEAYEDTATYVTKGNEDNSYVVFISSNVRFYDIETPAPMLTWAYVVQEPDGTYHMLENDKLDDAQKALVEDVSRSEDIIALDAQMRKDLAAAVTSDLQLGTLYAIWVQNASTNESGAESSESSEESTEEGTVESIEGSSSEDVSVSIEPESAN